MIKCRTDAIAVQYKEKVKSKIGGAGSGSLNMGDKGPTKTSLMGYIIVAIVLFHATDDADPGNQSPFIGKSLTSDPKSELEIN
ncbi:hypothetical protein CPT03_16015 [Pedobacter ginsengisoli]|uniref:Uncharacterized protein n=1 Tax=Pedobacter ginsengisoli TaxID=363852 RepID=A0A2D1U8B3_9SPHI|nr:hypothetical protein [Pedobacter ginsengisoli]ATP57857.1 hypothetical protein CPT03_16015 [Pedobacter ginsengisoli]